MKKKILAGILSVLMSMTMYSPIRAEEPETPATDEPEVTDVIETEQKETAEQTAAAEVSVAPEEDEDPVLAAEEQDNDPVIAEEPVESEDPEMIPGEEPDGEEEPAIVLNSEAFRNDYTVGDLAVSVSYEAGTVPEGTEVRVSPAGADALAALEAAYGDVMILAADISFWYNDSEIEPKDYSDKAVSVSLGYRGEDDLGEQVFNTVHVSETVGEDGMTVYAVDPVMAVMTDITETVQTPVYESREIMETVSVPYEYTWTEIVTKYKDVDVYEDVQVPYEEEIPVYETRDVTKEVTTYVTKTRPVEKTRTVKVKKTFKWYNPLTWFGSDYVTETYIDYETYKEPVTKIVVIGTEEVQVGTETVTKYRTESRYVRTDKVADGTEEIQHTETRYREETVGTGRYEDVVTGYTEETVVVGQTYTFAADDFSVYSLVWDNADDPENPFTADVHWGTYTDGVFNDLATTTTIDSTASTVKLDVIIDGYYFVGAVYYATEESEGVNLTSTTLHKAADGTYTVALEDIGTVTIADGSVIHVNYAPKGSGGYTPPPAPDPELLRPETDKTVTDNEDGTYTIQLDVEGHEDETVTQVGANVIVVMDITQSMTNNMPGSTTTRMAAAKSALTTLVNTLNPDTNLINFTAVNFGDSANYSNGVNWTTTKTSMLGYVNGLPNNPNQYGTCWQAGLQGGIDRVNQAASNPAMQNNQTYVIFVTDGNPNCYTDNRGRWHASTGPNFDQNSYNAAVPNANTLGSISNLYGVFVGDAAGYDHLDDLITNAGGVQTINGTSSSAIEQAFGEIAQTIVDNIGAGSVTVDDGIPTLANVSANVPAGEAGGFEYYITPKNGTQTVWEGAPGASYDSSNGVTWNISEAGTLKDGWTYTLKFTVWPSQAAYDLIADLNNGLRFYNYAAYLASVPDGETPLSEAEAKAQGLVISDTEKSAVTGSKETGYTMLTNTHLYTTFKDLDGNEYREAIGYEDEAMPLPTETITVKKNWPANMLDQYGEAVYRDDDGVEHTASSILLTLMRDSEEYYKFTVSKTNGWKRDENDPIYISCGNMTIDDNGVVTIHETGHDYQITEPKGFSYYWDLISDVYHPMVINGTATMLIYDKTLKTADNVNTFEINGKYYRKSSGTGVDMLEAYNYRRSNLNLTKVVSNSAGLDGIEDEYFTYKAKVTDAQSNDGYVWFSVWDPDVIVKSTDWVISGATPEDGNTGYWYAANGAEITFKIKAGWNVRFLNLYHDTTFSFEETAMSDIFEIEDIDADTQFNFMDEISEDWYTVSAENNKLITGKITEPNNSYIVTYTNKPKPQFYIYHSGVAGDGNLEIIPMSAVGADGKYNLFAKTTEGTLYGGYYLDYAGKGTYADDGKPGTNGVAYTGMNYTWTDPQTELGTAMTPVAGETYYIKEVPTYYLRNYHQITYLKAQPQTLTALYLISAVDDVHYNQAGFILKSTDNQRAIVAAQMSFTNTATNKKVTLKANTVFNSLGIKGEGSDKNLLTYWDATNTSYFAVNSFTVLPYWVTPDMITVEGVSTRTINIASMNKSGITKTDSE